MKKYINLPILIIALGSWAFAMTAMAQTATSSFTLPDDFTANIWTNVGLMLTPLAPYIELIVGVVLAAVVLEVIIGAIKK
jgi:hypothetical protein